MPQDRILVVDDDAGVTALCERLLTAAGFDVVGETRPQAALERLDGERFDVLLTDIRMPGVDGFQLMQQAHELAPEMATVIITAYGSVETAVEALRRGAEGLVLKPFDSGAVLVDAVKDALRVRRQARDAARLRVLRPMFEVSQALLLEVEPERLHERILSAVEGQLDAPAVAIYTLGEDGETLQRVAYCGAGERLPATAPVGDAAGLLGRVVAQGTPIWVVQDSLDAALRAAELATVLCAPMLLQGRATGVLLAGKYAGEGQFREGDLELLTILAGQVGVALENSRLYAQLRAHVRQIEDSQQQLIQAEKLAALGRLAGSIAHEVNNPLQAIHNCLHLTQRPELPAERRGEYTEMALGEVGRLIDTVQQMLDLYRPAEVDFEPVALAPLLEEVVSLTEQSLRDNQVSIVLTTVDGAPAALPSLAEQGLAVHGAANSLKQVFLNLILNAGEAMEGGGTLTIETTPVAERNQVRIAFRDTGPGIEPDELPHLFEPFYTTKKRGTGLGLAISYSIVEAHGGRIEVESRPSGGATFGVYLPLAGRE